MTTTLLTALLLAFTGPRSPAKKNTVATAAPRTFDRRSVVIDDATTAVELHVAAQTALTLAFPQKVKQGVLPDAKGYFQPDKQARADRLFIVLAEKELPKGEVVTLQITLEDGTLLPPFLLSSSPASADIYVDFDVKLLAKASVDSAAKLKAQVAELQGKVDDCEASAGERGAIKVAELVLRQDWNKPAAFVVEKHSTRALDKQSGLLVQTRAVYRLFDTTYLVMSVENRDPDKQWVLEKAQVAVEDGNSSVEARVLDVALDMSQGIPPGQEARLVLAFKTPAQGVDHEFTVQLLEKSGNRHVKLDGLKL